MSIVKTKNKSGVYTAKRKQHETRVKILALGRTIEWEGLSGKGECPGGTRDRGTEGEKQGKE